MLPALFIIQVQIAHSQFNLCLLISKVQPTSSITILLAIWVNYNLLVSVHYKLDSLLLTHLISYPQYGVYFAIHLPKMMIGNRSVKNRHGINSLKGVLNFSIFLTLVVMSN